MSDQNYSNHSRLVPGFHFVAFAFILIATVLSVRSLIVSFSTAHLEESILLVSLALGLLLVAWYARAFALKVQDRAIRAEENLRNYVRNGTLLDAALTMRQIIALRFASDEEYDALASEAIQKGLSEDDIKKAIKNWRSDTDRA
jgi:hypothetical protein